MGANGRDLPELVQARDQETRWNEYLERVQARRSEPCRPMNDDEATAARLFDEDMQAIAKATDVIEEAELLLELRRPMP